MTTVSKSPKKPSNKLEFKKLTQEQRALKYAARGLLVVPMHTANNGHCACAKGDKCESPGKHPATSHGVKDATTDKKTIKQWWTDNPEINVGIAPSIKHLPALKSLVCKAFKCAKHEGLIGSKGEE